MANGPTLKESDAVRPGDRMHLPVATPLGNVGLQVCYDLRFPEVSRYQRNHGAHILTFPSAFTVKTGQAHWGPQPRWRTGLEDGAGGRKGQRALSGQDSHPDHFRFFFVCVCVRTEVLLRARAIENQCYVIAAAQTGQHNAKRASYGHGMVGLMRPSVCHPSSVF